MKASAVSKDLRTPKYKMRVEPSKLHYVRNGVEEQREIADDLENASDDSKYDEYDMI